MNETAPRSDSGTIERAVRATRQMYPQAAIKVRRGRVIVVDGDLIRLVSYADLDHAHK